MIGGHVVKGDNDNQPPPPPEPRGMWIDGTGYVAEPPEWLEAALMQANSALKSDDDNLVAGNCPAGPFHPLSVIGE